jgi:hypothetical protein
LRWKSLHLSGAIRTGHKANLLLTQFGDDFSKKVPADANVTVGYDEAFMLCSWQHVVEVAHFRVLAERSGRDDKLQIIIWEKAHELPDDNDGWVVRVLDSEDDLKLGIILAAKGCVVGESLEIDTTKGDQNAHRRESGGFAADCHMPEKPAGRIDAKYTIDDGECRQQGEERDNGRSKHGVN